MKDNRFLASLCFFLCFFLMELSGWQRKNLRILQTSAVSDKILRLHIIAEDDSERAQELKLLVRDAITASLSPLPEAIQSKSDAIAFLRPLLPQIKSTADRILSEEGAAYTAEISLEQRYFPMKTYGDYRFPEGSYDALCVTLGAGNGQNWWCLVFPRFCFVEDCYSVNTEDAASELKMLLTDEEYELILKQKPKVRIRFLDWLKELFQT